MIINSVTSFSVGETAEKLIYQPSNGSELGTLRFLTISSFLPSIPTLTPPERGALALAEEWDERYSEHIKAGKHRKLGIYFKFPNSNNLIRRFGVLVFNQSPAKDIDLLEMLITRPDKLSLNPGTSIYGKIEPGTYGGLESGDVISVWVGATEKTGGFQQNDSINSITALWKR